LFDKFKDDQDSVILLDPPYLQSCNSFYENADVNLYEYFFNNPINKVKSSLYLILEDNWIIKLLFKKFIIHKYGKTYEISKKKTSHLIISNKK